MGVHWGSGFDSNGGIRPDLFHTDTDLVLRFLSLGGVVVVGGFTVRAVVFTVIVGCSGVCHDQQLLDVTLEQKKRSMSATEAMSTNFTGPSQMFFKKHLGSTTSWLFWDQLNSGTKDSDAVCIDGGVVAPVEGPGNLLLTVHDDGDTFLFHADSYTMPSVQQGRNKVDGAEEGVLLRGRLAMLVLIQEDGGTAHLHAELLDALLVVHGQQEGLEASLWLDGELLKSRAFSTSTCSTVESICGTASLSSLATPGWQTQTSKILEGSEQQPVELLRTEIMNEMAGIKNGSTVTTSWMEPRFHSACASLHKALQPTLDCRGRMGVQHLAVKECQFLAVRKGLCWVDLQ
ncbi:hypothetical protein EYF80_001194 [Liparis tanakae]|uniref:Uncharacterized protein n=1 Tax=Liparis tanakae TaxID=230148 RepID=A0A4Z2JGP1_9TELE|nr:hypothetical protein EYF80_001194 [Liparis tanakae]